MTPSLKVTVSGYKMYTAGSIIASYKMSLSVAGVRLKLRPYAKAKKWNKCFCIGSHKTGTTTMNALMNLLGYDCAPELEMAMSTSEQLQHGLYQELFEKIRQYDFFQDSPFSDGLTWVALDSAFPGSKFIYTYRDPESWFESLVRFQAKNIGKAVGEVSPKDIADFSFLRSGFLKTKTEYFWLARVDDRLQRVVHDWSLLYDKKHYIHLYIERRDQILKYFQRREQDLLVIDLTKEDSVKPIADFLELPCFVNFSIPAFNATDEADNNYCVNVLDSRLAEILLGK
ncbi:sulfotransferase [Synechococcus sp. CBW1006]|uniref:sulfotransferase n=1 Tax=Synechococcus sp. CBW1006 TaxID=1353138 RepID=UPI0018CD2E81|nr:sulfotransferase [Synechococcus sp. CBW1006]QPN67255.1 hypothetical protein H8F26_03175 [Synechococcus sp. CBW1006]